MKFRIILKNDSVYNSIEEINNEKIYVICVME